MPSPPLSDLLTASDALPEAVGVLRARGCLTCVDPARPLVIAALGPGPWLVVTPTSQDAERLTHELAAFTDRATLFPAWETLPHERLSPRPETVARRYESLRRVRAGEADIVVAPVLATMQHMVPGAQDVEPVRIRRGSEADLDLLIRDLVALDYRRTDLVERRGEFAVRGGLLDLFPPAMEHPVRIEFFGDEVESIRTFAVASQRSLEQIDAVDAYPCRELLPTMDVRGRAVAAIETYPSERIELDRLADGSTFDGVEALIELLWESPPVLREVLDEPRVLVCDPKRTQDRAADLIREVEELRTAAWQSATDGARPPAQGGLAGMERALGDGVAELTAFRGDNDELPASIWDVQRGDLTRMTMAAKQLASDGLRVIACGTTDGSAERIREVLAQHDVVDVTYVVAPIEAGFWSPALGVALIGEHDLFGKRRAHRTPRASRGYTTPLDLNPGDLVVHVVHGVGTYEGTITRSIGEGAKDYITISYADGDKLYVPADQLDVVSKYVGAESPKLNRLGGSEWARQKARVRRAVRDMADELIALYAARANARGHAFEPDQAWQRELEDAFPYVETKDQLAAIDDVKADMEADKPMDRLICGDVGFGKTEIAIRAAFKAVLDGKQVAVLVPTTLLAQQHYATFSERFAPFPVRVGMLSRFIGSAKARQVMDDIAAHRMDVVIGTHRLLQKGVNFADLGLIIVDEEQRFGVSHKERLKKLKTSVDVLTMTATPIPRTLEMAMGGLRDMSVIDTPPEDRHPVLTFVGPASDEQITRAIRREMLRDGQTFFVHNTVSDIEKVAVQLRRLVPDARIGVAHGQMNEKQLEAVMLDFWDRNYDVLLSTTIIESGLDIPTANTLIVDRADRLGLSQLYQLRGRVGRSRERAYAYFLYPSDRSLTEVSHHRLAAIGRHTDLGSGLQIALRDLEIRGAGNLLGGEQSGHIGVVGFDLYIKMLGDAVAEAKGTKPEPKPDVTIDLPVDAHLPEEWIPREGLRLEAYRRIAGANSEADLEDVRAELTDRFGPLPPQAEELFTIARIRFVLGPRGTKNVVYANDNIRIEPIALSEHEIERLLSVPGAVFKKTTYAAIIPLPSAPEGGAASWLLRGLGELLDED